MSPPLSQYSPDVSNTISSHCQNSWEKKTFSYISSANLSKYIQFNHANIQHLHCLAINNSIPRYRQINFSNSIPRYRQINFSNSIPRYRQINFQIPSPDKDRLILQIQSILTKKIRLKKSMPNINNELKYCQLGNL